METREEHWPDRGAEILATTTILCVLSTMVLLWRIVYKFQSKQKWLICDFLLIVAAILNVANSGIRFKTVIHGSGRHIQDPSISKPYDITEWSYYLWLNQAINMIAVAMLKYSICLYLLALKFSKFYVAVIWVSILMVSVLNFILPTISVFCKTPFEANWNKGVPGKCFMPDMGPGMVYTQGVSNVVTDVVYVIAPIIYLSTVQLDRRTQWGLRIVFLLGVIATICSIVKTVELSALKKTHDPTWDGSSLSIWSATELSVGILITSLPPMRKQFEAFFRRVLPSTFKSKARPSAGSMPLYNISKMSHRRSRRDGDDNGDGDSERRILQEEEQVANGKITKTTVHEIRSEEKGSSVQVDEPTYRTSFA